MQAQEAEESHNGQVPLHYPASSSSGNESGPPVIDTSNDAESSDAYPIKKRKLNKASEKIESEKDYMDVFEALLNNAGTYERCTSCNVAMIGTNSRFQLAVSTINNCCIGCTKMDSIVVTRGEKTDFNMWLKTHKIPQHDRPLALTPEDFKKRLSARRKGTKGRISRKNSNGSNLAHVDELEQMCRGSNFKCVITGSEIAFQNKYEERYPYWALSIDHKKPLTHWKNDPVVFDKITKKNSAAMK
ncbi:hypothetical protein INT47_005842 [Mucor saturninus]|uniref:Uncharacterized protein n=1 Tax=Mucor saturninus TaxID=64648 RepID=A0A8H7R014_9FUNG|nr:hypothetical protein INT47_005842 [Mucor saturninus]